MKTDEETADDAGHQAQAVSFFKYSWRFRADIVRDRCEREDV